MKKIIHRLLCTVLAIVVLMLARGITTAQQITPAQGEKNIARSESSGVSGSDGRVSFKLKQGDHVAVDNRTTGRIRIIGWDEDRVEAVATSERGAEAVRFSIKESPERFIWLKADYLKREEDEISEPEAPPAVIMPPSSSQTPSPPVVGGEADKFRLPERFRKPEAPSSNNVIEPPRRDGKPIEVHLEVRVPRYAEIELIRVTRSPVEVTGVKTPLVILGDKSDVILKGVGKVEVRTRSGAVEIQDAAGYVEVITSSGAVRVRRAQGDVRALSISGNIEIECVRGRVNVDTADGSIALANIEGDVEASASNSDVIFTGAIREDGRYHLKTMSGTVEMAVRDQPPGFTAALSSYQGTIENDFQLQIKRTIENDQNTVNRRIVGNYGDGQAQITLDSFDGKVKLAKSPPGAMKDCK